jgi:hypothetical protein
MPKPRILVYRDYAIKEQSKTQVDVVAMRNYSETLARFRQRVVNAYPGYECLKVVISNDGEESFEKIKEN